MKNDEETQKKHRGFMTCQELEINRYSFKLYKISGKRLFPRKENLLGDGKQNERKKIQQSSTL